jgi:hypothetical protein
MESTYDERPLADIKRLFEQLVARGELEVGPATADDLRRARIPAHAGSVFVSTARAYRSVRLIVADVVFHLHEGGEVEAEPGGWRLRAEPLLATPKASSAATTLHSPISPILYCWKRCKTAAGLALMM